MQIYVEKLNAETFAEFGRVLGKPVDIAPTVADATSASWLGISGLMDIGTRPARHATYLEITARPACYDKMEKHESSAEAFIPLEGVSILLVAPAEALDAQGGPDMSRARAFLLDGSQGILMRPATWHAVPYTLTPSTTVLVLVDDAIIPQNDLHITPVEPVEFVLNGDLQR